MPRLQAQTELKKILKNYFTKMEAPIAWCTSAGPAEILRACGFEVYFPENHGAMLGATRKAGDYIPRAHQAGYHGEICSYLTSDIGAFLSKETPLTQAYGLKSIPKPDLIVFNTNQCREVAEWFGFFAREYDCPLVGIFPPRYLEEVTQSDINNVVEQFSSLITVAEKVIGRKLDPAKLEETLSLSQAGTKLWKKVLETAALSPSPLTFFDGTILMAPIVILRGTRICVDFYKNTLAELEAISAADKPAVPDEKIRLYWEGMPIWGRLRSQSEFFTAHHAAVVASTYCNSWVFDDFDPADPLPSMARAYTKIFINRGENAKLAMLTQLIDQFHVDGIIYHDAKTCFNNSNNRFGLPDRVRAETDLDYLIIDGDLNDLRFLSEGQTLTKLETFIEQVEGKKEKKEKKEKKNRKKIREVSK